MDYTTVKPTIITMIGACGAFGTYLLGVGFSLANFNYFYDYRLFYWAYSGGGVPQI